MEKDIIDTYSFYDYITETGQIKRLLENKLDKTIDSNILLKIKPNKFKSSKNIYLEYIIDNFIISLFYTSDNNIDYIGIGDENNNYEEFFIFTNEQEEKLKAVYEKWS